jgi:hypothetical protein
MDVEIKKGQQNNVKTISKGRQWRIFLFRKFEKQNILDSFLIQFIKYPSKTPEFRILTRHFRY